jgi:hypothetical protein
MKHRFRYPTWRKRRGTVSITLAVCCEAIFGFILFVGFGDWKWMPCAFAALSLFSLIPILRGVLLMRSAKQSIETDDLGITLCRNGREIRLEYQSITKARCGWFFEPYVRLYTNGKSVVVYKTLPGYPLLWSMAVRACPVSKTDGSCQTRKITCFCTQHTAAFLMGALLALFAALQMIRLLRAGELAPMTAGLLCTLFVFVAAAAIWALVKDWKVYVIGKDGIAERSWRRSSFYPTGELKAVLLEQTEIGERVTGYAYRGEAMTRAVRYRAVDLGLRIRIAHAGGELTIDDGMTFEPIELLFGELCRKFQLSGTITIPQLEETDASFK